MAKKKEPNLVIGCLMFVLVSVAGGIGIVAWISGLPEPSPEEMASIERSLIADDLARAQRLEARIKDAQSAGLHREAGRLAAELEKVLAEIERSMARLKRTEQRRTETPAP